MNTFELWAPKARRVDLVSGGLHVPMQPVPGGHWRVEADVQNYGYSLDGSRAFPDPRSPWQPEGVDGPSRVVDHSRFHWQHPDFQALPIASAVIYELHVGTFTPEGTFLAIISKLAHLKSLGITHIELMPINQFSGSWGWGYDGVDLYAPHSAYGSPDDLKTLIDACHAEGLAVLLDVVYNHFGPIGNYLAQFAPYFNPDIHTPWGAVVDLKVREVRRYLCDNALMWLRDYHFDGLRFDAVHALIDPSEQHLLEQLAGEVAQMERPAALIAENAEIEPHIVKKWGLTAQWFDGFHHALHSLLTGETNGYYDRFGRFSHLADAIRQDQLEASNLIVFLQNHDQVGNRAAGERMSTLVDINRLKTGAALTILSPFVPLLFQGEEWGARQPFQYFTNFDDPSVAESVSKGRKREFLAFGWQPDDVPDPQDPATFQRSKLDWSRQDPEILDWYRNLIALRRSKQ